VRQAGAADAARQRHAGRAGAGRRAAAGGHRARDDRRTGPACRPGRAGVRGQRGDAGVRGAAGGRQRAAAAQRRRQGAGRPRAGAGAGRRPGAGPVGRELFRSRRQRGAGGTRRGGGQPRPAVTQTGRSLAGLRIPMTDTTEIIRGVLIQVADARLLLPNATIAEVLSYAAPEPVADAPDWLLGRIRWRGWQLPLLAFSRFAGIASGEQGGLGSKVVVLKALG